MIPKLVNIYIYIVLDIAETQSKPVKKETEKSK